MSLKPLLVKEQNFHGSEVWIRISAFLSLKSVNTQLTYKGIIEEWCDFLGSKAGTKESSEKIIKATDLHAIAYKKWLEEQPGETPRRARRNIKENSKKRDLAINDNKYKKTTKLGLENTLSNATISKKFAALRRLYRMLISAKLGIPSNPFDTDLVPIASGNSGKKRPTEMIDFSLVQKIVNSPDEKTEKGRRDRALLAILFGGALRRSEASKLTLGDVRKTRSGTTYLYLRSTKAKRDAEQALPNWASEYVWELVGERRKNRALEGDYLFVSYKGFAGKTASEVRISDSGIYKLFLHYCRISGAGDFVTPHSARATAITKLLEDGIPHREVQEFSRHSSVQMVEAYDKRRIGVDQNPGRNLDFDIHTMKKSS